MNLKATIEAPEGTSIITITRTFNAPRDKVFKAFTDPALISRWWGMSGKARIEENELKEGGKWRYVETGPDGTTTTFFGIFHEITAPERIVQTGEWAELGERGHVALDRTVFTEENGKTTMILTEVYLSVETRDLVLKSGMEEGLQQSYQHLDALLAEQ